jgi:hypothetical protein
MKIVGKHITISWFLSTHPTLHSLHTISKTFKPGLVLTIHLLNNTFFPTSMQKHADISPTELESAHSFFFLSFMRGINCISDL